MRPGSLSQVLGLRDRLGAATIRVLSSSSIVSTGVFTIPDLSGMPGVGAVAG
jgi:hypothetical protein